MGQFLEQIGLEESDWLVGRNVYPLVIMLAQLVNLTGRPRFTVIN
jgi:hypothetical protein